MKDSMGQELKPGAIVVVKPTSRDSWMGMGYVKKVNGSSATVTSYRRTSWYDKESKRVTGSFETPSIYIVKDVKEVHLLSIYNPSEAFPDVFPEALKPEYTELFL